VPLAQTGFAIGSVSRLLVNTLTTALWNMPPHNPTISVKRPQAEPSSGSTTHPRLNLFLYEVEIDGAMRNIRLTPGTSPPLWVVLRYLITAFDNTGESDTLDGHDLLGMGLQALMAIQDVLPDPVTYPALADNPEPLKLTFDQGTPELLSRLMQGPDDKYRCSAAFQVRPVLIAQPQLSGGLQLIGINYVLGTTIGLAGVRNFVLPSMGPQLDGAKQTSVEIGDTLTLIGSGLGAPGLTANLGAAAFVPSMQQPQALNIAVDALDPTIISAGNQSVYVSQTLVNGLALTSGVVNVALLPTVTGMTILSIAAVSSTNSNVYASISVAGLLLGTKTDYVEFALVRNGAVVLLLDSAATGFTPPADQSQQQFAIPNTTGVPPGAYLAVLRVNGQQARQPFTLNLALP
jgi:hypothetical protein